MLRSVTVRRWDFWRSSVPFVLSVGEDMCMLSVGWWMVFWLASSGVPEGAFFVGGGAVRGRILKPDGLCFW